MKYIKDPIYGYIEIDDSLCLRILDTPEFQRLRRIVQTSYAALYPSAFHNRFVHSLGVYHLGRIATRYLETYVKELYKDDEAVLEHWKSSRRTFEIACFMHDFGHAPFSHTGESFFAKGSYAIDERLIELVEDTRYRPAPSL